MTQARQKKQEKLYCTKDYDLFTYTPENRPVDARKRRDLRESMRKYGFDPMYPINCIKHNGKLVIQDGQHRFAVAQSMSLPVWYGISETRINIAERNATQHVWRVPEYAASFAAQGNKHYTELLDFRETTGIPLSIAVMMLGDSLTGRGTSHMGMFREGRFKVVSRSEADRAASLFLGVTATAKHLRTRFFAHAIMAVCLVRGLDDQRLISGAKRCSDALVKYGDRAGFLGMLEYIYNNHRTGRVPLKFLAEEAAKKRNGFTAEQRAKRAAASG